MYSCVDRCDTCACPIDRSVCLPSPICWSPIQKSRRPALAQSAARRPSRGRSASAARSIGQCGGKGHSASHRTPCVQQPRWHLQPRPFDWARGLWAKYQYCSRSAIWTQLRTAWRGSILEWQLCCRDGACYAGYRPAWPPQSCRVPQALHRLLPRETGRGHDSYNISKFDFGDSYLPQYEMGMVAEWHPG